MAKKQKTPQTILDAPKLTPVHLVEYTAPSHAERRHPDKIRRKYPAEMWAAINIPFRGRAGVRSGG